MAAGAMVGGAFLSSTLQVLFDRLASQSVMDFVRGQKLSDALLKKLKMTLLTIKVVLNDAEEKQITDATVKAWLDELKDATYDAEDLLDEIATEALRCKLEAESCTSTNQVQNFISNSLNLTDERINSKIEGILERLKYIEKQKNVLGLKEVVGGKPSQKLSTSSLVDEFGVYGRDDDRDEIVKSLLSDDASGNEICVITIVGMAGIGKTTLAQLVYNDYRLMKKFDLKAWVFVSEEFDILRITKTILETITSSTSDINDLNLLQVELKKWLSGKKFLLILDDVWSENYNDWDILRSPFISAKQGSKIIVTTRNESVASTMCTTPSYHLKQLLDVDCWLLFEKHAFYNGSSSPHPDLEVTGREIVKKCKGLPLAAKTLGGLLRSKVSVEEWEKILKSDIWDLPNNQSNILPALRLSYQYLPPHLKQCFAYCSIFPKGYEFEKEKLVLLWMAEDLLQQTKRNIRIEDLGDEYFFDLVSRSFFHRSSGNESHFIMHDLLNDLAKFVSKEFCVRLEGDNLHEILKTTRYFSYCRTRYDVSKKFEAFNDATRLRTFLPLDFLMGNEDSYLTNKVPQDLLPSLRCLRVLSFSHYHNISELPVSIGNLKHLRYLDLSYTATKKLPDSTTTLFNLQTLLLFKCHSLTELPIDLWRLINLRHLNISGTNLKEMPRHISKLRSLQTLSTFIVSRHSGSMITELRESKHLRGALHILQLQNVVHATDALQVKLKDKKYLDELVLEWSSNNEDSQNERYVLDKLQPHANLKKLTLKNYGGMRFPEWIGDHSFHSMTYLCLSNCKYCFSLPPLGQLPCLKDLSIVGLNGVEMVGPEFYGDCSFAIKPFQSLEILKFEEMLELVGWFCLEDEGGSFPCLRELYIKNCPKLAGSLPGNLPSLKRLLISDCQQLVASLPRTSTIRVLDLINCDKVVLRSNNELTSHPFVHVPEISNVTGQPPTQMTTLPNPVGLEQLSSIEILEGSGSSELKELPPWLHWLAIRGCEFLESLPEGMRGINSCLLDLEISDCPRLKSFPKGGLPTTLRTLHIENCSELELLPCGETMNDYYASLESLSVNRSCDSLEFFPLGLFPKLNHLRISDCKNLESLSNPDRNLTSLSMLKIWGCPKLVSFPIGGLTTSNLTFIWLFSCNNLISLPERMQDLLPSLEDLIIHDCPELESFPEGGLPLNLRTLSITNCDKLTARRREWRLQTLASLKYFGIGECEEVESFPEEWLLPSSLTFLLIWNFPNLKYLDMRGLQHLTSLEDLYILNCPELQSLPEEGLPISLSLLLIKESPLLEQRCQREKGEDWPNIAHIPSIMINGELIS